MKNVLISISIVLAIVVVTYGGRYSEQVVVDPQSYTLQVDPNDPIFAALQQQGDPAIYAGWQAQFGATERTKLIYDVSFNREVLVGMVQRLAALDARVTALEPAPIDPNTGPVVPLEDLSPEMRN